jgi:hypothetical protein
VRNEKYLQLAQKYEMHKKERKIEKLTHYVVSVQNELLQEIEHMGDNQGKYNILI